MFEFLASIFGVIWFAFYVARIVESDRPDRSGDSEEISPAERVRRLQKIDESNALSIEEEEPTNAEM